MHVPTFSYQRGGRVAVACSCGTALGRHRTPADARAAVLAHQERPDAARKQRRARAGRSS